VDADPDSIDREVHDSDVEPLRVFARDNLRRVTDKVVSSCVCMYTNTPDERFVATSPATLPGVTILSACSGHGFKFASVMGELMAGLVLDGKPLPPIVHSQP
jgi:sarcosine oxidase